jgi:TolB-like protein
MAGEIFISYRRADVAWARLLHELLKAEGVEAWYDAQVEAGQDWRRVTAQALEASRIFVLLFSSNAAQSNDIAKELAAATLENKLIVPVRLENIAPKGAFLYELASRNWINAYEDTEAKLAELARSLAHLVRTGARDESLLPFERAAVAKKPAVRRWWLIVAVAAVVLASLAGAVWLHLRPPPPSVTPAATRVAVLPFDVLSDSSQAKHFSESLTDEIVTRLNSNRIQVVSPEDAATLRGPQRAQKVAELGVALLFDGTVEDDGATVKVRVHLDDPVRHVTLWSGAADGASDKRDQVQATIASEIVGVLACSNRALVPAHGLTDPDLLSRYLHACDIFVRGFYSDRDKYDLLASLREVSAKAPDFVPAHSDLAKFALYFAATLPPGQAAPLRKEGEAEAHKALALDPKSPDAYLALSWLLPVTDWAGREKLLRQGVAADPSWPHTNGFLGFILAETGRLQESAGYLQKAATADLQIDWGPTNAGAECNAGQFDEAMSYLSDGLKRKPNDFDLQNNLVGCLYLAQRWSDWHNAIHDPSSRPATFTQQITAGDDTYFDAVQTRKPVAIAKAKALALASPSGSNRAITHGIEILAVLGLTDDAFELAKRYIPGAPLTGGRTDFLFGPLTTSLRRDPRFMVLVDRLKLVDFWLASGKWPDFCADSTLPYNCKKEASAVKANNGRDASNSRMSISK